MKSTRRRSAMSPKFRGSATRRRWTSLLFPTLVILIVIAWFKMQASRISSLEYDAVKKLLVQENCRKSPSLRHCGQSKIIHLTKVQTEIDAFFRGLSIDSSLA